jgi:hypothetical protein
MYVLSVVMIWLTAARAIVGLAGKAAAAKAVLAYFNI